MKIISPLRASFALGVGLILSGCVQMRLIALQPQQQNTATCEASQDLGTEAHPYLIRSTSRFLSVFANDSSSAHYLLCADLDFTGITYVPISKFSGTFDGLNRVISNVTLSSSSATYTAKGIGLFSWIDGGSISNLNLSAISFTNTVGGAGTLAGTATNARVSGVRVGTSAVTATQSVGGLIGDVANSEIAHAVFSGTVSLTTANLGAGGLVGRMVRTDGATDKIDIYRSVSHGTLSHIWYSNGGLIGVGGLADGSSFLRVEESGSDMAISVRAWSGGIAGDFAGIIKNCFFTGTITSSTGGRTGGLIGNNISGATTIESSFADHTDNRNANVSHGSVSGYIQAGSVTLIDTFGITFSIFAPLGTAASLVGASAQVTTAQLKTASFFPGSASDWADARIWTLVDGVLPSLTQTP